MKRFNRSGAAVLGALLILGSAVTQASHVLGAHIAGTVTAVTPTSITIDGKTYQVLSGSPAAQALSQVRVGQSVSVALDGSASAASTHVRLIQPTAKP